MVAITGNDALLEVATDARERLARALESLTASLTAATAAD